MNVSSKKVYVCHFLHHDGTPSVPMAIFSNRKAADEYINAKNAERENQWYYYATDMYREYWWKQTKED